MTRNYVSSSSSTTITTTTPSSSAPTPTLLTLPYDIRHLIYTHLFPAVEQLYLQASPARLTPLLPPAAAPLPTALLRANRQLHAEAAAYLYTRYLFNLVGAQRDCLAHYAGFARTVRAHARDPAAVRVDAFTNGPHSGTMCVSVQAGPARVALLESRRRGVWREIGEVEREVFGDGGGKGEGLTGEWAWYVGAAVLAVLVVVLAWLVARPRRPSEVVTCVFEI